MKDIWFGKFLGNIGRWGINTSIDNLPTIGEHFLEEEMGEFFSFIDEKGRTIYIQY